MKKEIYTKVVDEVVQRMAQHADVVMNVEQLQTTLACLLVQFVNDANERSFHFIATQSICISVR